MLRKYFLLFVLFSFVFADCDAQNGAAVDSTKIEERVSKTIFALPEVQELIAYNRKINNQYPVVTQIRRRPGADFKYYWLGVGADDGEMFTTFLHFYIDPKTFEVRYFDVFHMSVLTLKQWRGNKELHQKTYNPH